MQFVDKMIRSKRNSILTYTPGRKNHQTVKKEYIKWRQLQSPPIPLRCDNVGCPLHNGLLVWNDKELKLILDHINGVSGDNRPKNLRFLCPNCNSQLPTHGGANKGKVEQAIGGYSVKDKLGKKNHHLITDTTQYTIKGQKVEMGIKKKGT